MSFFKFKVVNCVIGGEQFTETRRRRVRNKIQLRLGKYDVEIVQKANFLGTLPSRLKGACNYTTDIFVQRSKNINLDSAIKVVGDICTLLSLATISQVYLYAYENDAGEAFYTTLGITLLFRPLIETRDGKTVRKFIEQAWMPYRKLKTPRKLPLIIDYLIGAELPLQSLEGKLLLNFVAMESLKATYARKKGIPYIENRFRKISNPPKANRKKEPVYKFEELMLMMLKDIRMRKGIKRAIKLRNEIVHLGLSRRPFASQMNAYNYCQDLIREYLLRLLNYKGKYYKYSNLELKEL